jgi:hypothetical protein
MPASAMAPAAAYHQADGVTRGIGAGIGAVGMEAPALMAAV